MWLVVLLWWCGVVGCLEVWYVILLDLLMCIGLWVYCEMVVLMIGGFYVYGWVIWFLLDVLLGIECFGF